MKFFAGLGPRTTERSTSIVDGSKVTVGPVSVSTVGPAMAVIGGLSVGSDDLALVSKSSSPSRRAPFSTLFDGFELVARPVYNFFVDDETVNADGDESLSTDELPRYILLTWKKAPVLRLRRYEAPTKTVRMPVANDISNGVSVAGLTVDAGRIDFDAIKGAISNGFAAPGAIVSVVDIVERQQDGGRSVLDEHGFLASDDVDGISFNDIMSNVNSIEDGYARGTALGGKATNRFSYVSDGETVSLVGVHSSSPAISFKAHASASPVRKVSRVPGSSVVVKKKGKLPTTNNVTFVDPAIDGIVSEAKVSSITKPEHAESTLALAEQMPDLSRFSDAVTLPKKMRNPIPSFPAPMELEGVEYIGYVIEKYQRSSSGAFELVDEIDVPDRDVGELVDSRILYGATYRYRIKAIVRWTRKNNVELEGVVAVDSVDRPFSQAAASFSSKSSFFETSWCREWAYAIVVDVVPPPPPDELTVRPESHRGRAVVSWKMPEDRQRDISGIVLYRRKRTTDGVDIGRWTQFDRMFPPKNGIFFDDRIERGFEHVYAAVCVTVHDEMSLLSDQIGCTIVDDWHDGELPVSFVSQAGVGLEDHGALAVRPPKRTPIDPIARDIVAVAGRTGRGTLSFDDMTAIVRLESLDTGERRDIRVDLDYNDVGAVIERSTMVAMSSDGRKLLTPESIGLSPHVGEVIVTNRTR